MNRSGFLSPCVSASAISSPYMFLSFCCLINLESRPDSQAPSLKPPQLLQAETSGSLLPVPCTSFNMLNVKAFLPFHHLCLQMVFLSFWAEDLPPLGVCGVEPSPITHSAHFTGTLASEVWVSRQVAVCSPPSWTFWAQRWNRILSRRKRKSVEVLGEIITVTHQFIGILAFRFHVGKLRACRSGTGSGRPAY